MKIIPLYRYKDLFLIGLDADYQTEEYNDGLVAEIDLGKKKIVHTPWSEQKKLKFGYYFSISKNERDSIYDLIKNELGEEIIDQIENMLLFPTQEAIDSLIWVPDRLKNIESEPSNKDSLS